MCLYSDNINAESCTPMSDCEAGSYISEAGTLMTDQVCSSCEVGSYSSSSNVSNCDTHTVLVKIGLDWNKQKK